MSHLPPKILNARTSTLPDDQAQGDSAVATRDSPSTGRRSPSNHPAPAGGLLPLIYDELRRLAGAYLAAERIDHTLQPTALVHEAFLRLARSSNVERSGPSAGDEAFGENAGTFEAGPDPQSLIPNSFPASPTPPDTSQWAEDRVHLYRTAALAMRRVLVNHARDRGRIKRGGGGGNQVPGVWSQVGDRLSAIGHRSSDSRELAADSRLTSDTSEAAAPRSLSPVDLLALDQALEKLGRIDPRKEQVVQLRYFGGFSVEETARMLEISPAQVKRDWAMARCFLLRELEHGG